MRRKAGTENATPPKEIYRSIIADYDLKLGICELVDNAIDIWHRGNKQGKLNVSVEIDQRLQKIKITDNAGGISQAEVVLFMSPGRTSNSGRDNSIGIFGVGSKRALVALAQNIRVQSRSGMQKTIEVLMDDAWLKEESWDFDVYNVDDISKDTTIIELYNLRNSITEEDIEIIEAHLGATYSNFISADNVIISLNGVIVNPIFFDNDWAYPPGYHPKEVNLVLPIEDSKLLINISAGLLKEGASIDGEYGVYFYCNNRLISRANRSFEVGYSRGKAGQPNHPSISLARVIVKMTGEAQFMPWNSSKSEINYNHKIFESIREELVNTVTWYASLSRRFQGEWPEKVFAFTKGQVDKTKIRTLAEIRNLYATPLPKVRVKLGDQIKQNNRELAKDKPWVIGLYEAIIAVDTMLKQNLQQKCRFALIMLDSTLEIAFKEYLANEVVPQIGASKLDTILHNRADVIKEIHRLVPTISSQKWQKISYYYKMRCNLVHQAATSNVGEEDVESYRAVVESILTQLFSIAF